MHMKLCSFYRSQENTVFLCIQNRSRSTTNVIFVVITMKGSFLNSRQLHFFFYYHFILHFIRNRNERDEKILHNPVNDPYELAWIVRLELKSLLYDKIRVVCRKHEMKHFQFNENKPFPQIQAKIWNFCV